MREIKEIFIHCSATPNGSKLYTIQDIDQWHSQRGFKRSYTYRKKHRPYLTSVGYHAYINVDGSLAEGRCDSETGAHARGHNEHSLGICMAGTDKFSEAQWETLRKWIVEKKLKYIDARIRGHNEVSSKRCPGFNVQEWLLNKMEPLEEHLHGR